MDKLATSHVDFMILMSHWFILDNELADTDTGGGAGDGGDGDDGGNDDDDDSNNNETAASPKVLAHVDLAKTICECSLSAVTTFFIPSNICGVNEMHCEPICAVPSWR